MIIFSIVAEIEELTIIRCLRDNQDFSAIFTNLVRGFM